MKGDNIFSNTILELFDNGTPPPPEDERSIGRDPELIERRDEHLMYRFHYYAAFTGQRWEIVRKLLSDEFYLSEVRVYKIVQENAAMRRRIMLEAPTVEQIRKKYPWMKW